MNYWLWLRRKIGDPVIYRDSLLPGLIPGRVMDMLSVAFAEEMELCRECSMAPRSHVIRVDGVKYCTVLFHDALRPSWNVENVL